MSNRPEKLDSTEHRDSGKCMGFSGLTASVRCCAPDKFE